MINSSFKAAQKWRSGRPDLANHGYVLMYQNQVVGWRDKLRDAATEKPGVLAIDCDGREFVAHGGNDEIGAKAWVVRGF